MKERSPQVGYFAFTHSKTLAVATMDVSATQYYAKKDSLKSLSVLADLETIDELGDDILGEWIKDICKDIPAEYRILHVEPVYRNDLVKRFRKRQHEMRSELKRIGYAQLRGSAPAKVVAMAKKLTEPHIAFHGTRNQAISSIVRWGFVKPGEKAGDNVVPYHSGPIPGFGYGIFSSPSLKYALPNSYRPLEYGQNTRPQDLPGMKLIVCAVLMGRALDWTTTMSTGLADPSADSLVSPDRMEYVVFDAAQIIPCYVLHIDFGAQKPRDTLRPAPEAPNLWETTRTHSKLRRKEYVPSEIEAIREAKKAAAAKWLPFGFGLATGASFVIEDIAEVDDDEEEVSIEVGGRLSRMK
jgi:hypothetical protein